VQTLGPRFVVKGVVTVSPETKTFAREVMIRFGSQSGRATVNPADGTWTFSGAGFGPATLTATSSNAGVAVYNSYQTQPPVAPASVPAKLKGKRGFTRR